MTIPQGVSDSLSHYGDQDESEECSKEFESEEG